MINATNMHMVWEGRDTWVMGRIVLAAFELAIRRLPVNSICPYLNRMGRCQGKFKRLHDVAIG